MRTKISCGWLAGHEAFALYGALVFLESVSRFCFALAVAVGIGHGLGGVALGMAVAPFVSLTVIPFAMTWGQGTLFITVLWALGWSMMALALLIHLPIRALAVLSVAAVVKVPCESLIAGPSTP